MLWQQVPYRQRGTGAGNRVPERTATQIQQIVPTAGTRLQSSLSLGKNLYAVYIKIKPMNYSGLEAISLSGQGGHFRQYIFNILLYKTDLYNTIVRCLCSSKSSDLIEAQTKHAREKKIPLQERNSFLFFLYKYLDVEYEIQVVPFPLTHKIFNSFPSTWSYA